MRVFQDCAAFCRHFRGFCRAVIDELVLLGNEFQGDLYLCCCSVKGILFAYMFVDISRV